MASLGNPPASSSPGGEGHVRIGEMLVREGLISTDQLQQGLAKQKETGGRLVETMIEMGFFDARAFSKFLSRQPGIASIDVLNYAIPREVIELIPKETALAHEILPLDKMGSFLTVGMVCPLDVKTIDELQAHTGLRIKALLVSGSDLRSALQSYYGEQAMEPMAWSDTMGGDFAPAESAAKPAAPAQTSTPVTDLLDAEARMARVKEVVREIETLPALPETVERVRAAVSDPDVSTAQVAEIIARDPALAAKVISLANAAGFGFSFQIETVERATTLLGLGEVYGLVVTSSVVEYFKNNNHFDYEGFWRRCVTAGIAARAIGKVRSRREGGALFAAGVLHDIGRSVFAFLYQDEYHQVAKDLDDVALAAAEEQTYGLSHAEAGYLLADHWNLPDDFKLAIRFHRRPHETTGARDLVYAVALAAEMADNSGITGDPEKLKAFIERIQPFLQALELDQTAFLTAWGETTADIKQEFDSDAS